MKIALFGASGRLGRMIAELAAGEKDLVIAEAIAHPASAALGQELFGQTIQPSFQNRSDVLIDVTLSSVFPMPLEEARKGKKPIVIGVTGLNREQMKQLEEAAKEIPVFYSPNFSLGMAIFREMTKIAARRFDPGATADIIEAHHKQKKDAPSGSARWIGQELEKLGKTPAFHSIRSGKIIGEHTLILNSDDERLEISHVVHSRNAFARGALAAARFLLGQKPSLYGMDDLFI